MQLVTPSVVPTAVSTAIITCKIVFQTSFFIFFFLSFFNGSTISFFSELSQVFPHTPCKGKSFKTPGKNHKAFALTGRLADCYYTQGDALG